MSSLWTHAHAVSSASALGASTGNVGGAASALRPGNSAAARMMSMPSANAATSSAATGQAAAAEDSSSSDDSGSTVSANDFLTLLVAEMQNQDPTADTDPNEYINQLVNINSLEQLISINQDLETVLGEASTGSTSSDATTASGSGGTGSSKAENSTSSSQHAAAAKAASGSHAGTHTRTSAGNLSTPADSEAATTVSHSLGGHVHGGPAHGKSGFTAVRDFRSSYLSR